MSVSHIPTTPTPRPRIYTGDTITALLTGRASAPSTPKPGDCLMNEHAIGLVRHLSPRPASTRVLYVIPKLVGFSNSKTNVTVWLRANGSTTALR